MYELKFEVQNIHIRKLCKSDTRTLSHQHIILHMTSYPPHTKITKSNKTEISINPLVFFLEAFVVPPPRATPRPQPAASHALLEWWRRRGPDASTEKLWATETKKPFSLLPAAGWLTSPSLLVVAVVPSLFLSSRRQVVAKCPTSRSFRGRPIPTWRRGSWIASALIWGRSWPRSFPIWRPGELDRLSLRVSVWCECSWVS